MPTLLTLTVLLLAPAPIEGVVVYVGEGEVVVDLGADRGLKPAAPLRLFRRLTLTHPITQKKIEDRFPIGEAKAAEVGALLTIIRDVKGLARPPAVGDFAVYGAAPLQPAPSTTPPRGEDELIGALRRGAPRDAHQAALIAEERALGEALEATLAQPLDARIARWGDFIAAYPDGRYAEAIAAEIASLRALLEDTRRRQIAAPRPAPPAEITTRFQGPVQIEVNRRLDLALAVIPPDAPTAARLFWRRQGEIIWAQAPLRRDGRFYHRLTFPAAALTAPGVVEYFIEIVRGDALLMPVAGDSKRPRRLQVRPAPLGAEGRGGSALKLESRYVDFNTVGEAVDRYIQFEGTFAYEINWRALKVFRVGMGSVDGEGGETKRIDAGAPTTKLALNYAFAEAELGLGHWVGLAARGYTGNHHTNAEGVSESVSGAEARLRLGGADSTRLVLGAQIIDALGSKAFADMHITVFPKAPIKASVAVTGLPVDADLGVQLGLQSGYQVSERLSVLGELGWNVRTINHHGLTLGAGLGLSW
ncbi:hypothetical protein KKF91_05310 [Myxococcota bacterium]|nr:hypothetical protein [Myxococcota bacterium]